MTTPPSTDRAAIGHVIDGLIESGWKLDRVYDGEEDVPTPTKAEAIEAITAVDDAFLHVTGGTTTPVETGWVRFVMGNDPEEVVCDHTINLNTPINRVVHPWWE